MNPEFMRGVILQLFEYEPCFESFEAWTDRHTMMLTVVHLMIVAKAFGLYSFRWKILSPLNFYPNHIQTYRCLNILGRIYLVY
ncbi:hypothetical protein [Mastigocoleus sp. MO_188.B34]|uniref:hypothetical protein n=1 Tax=Mastigocoleus sp. MO_188.B34 TaxID=3036635 RepID=UPI00261DDFE3|nr:hypothetical protein [Mastigocoleus sp. MO_188.B34]MDJ0695429.1 hypothetical protein [Mastigocoleus sp. MO_188.B34]